MGKNPNPSTPTAVELTAEIMAANKGPKRKIELKTEGSRPSSKSGKKKLKSLGVSEETIKLTFTPKTLKGRRVVLTEDANGPLGVTGDSEIIRRNIASLASYKRCYDKQSFAIFASSYEAFEFWHKGVRKQAVEIRAINVLDTKPELSNMVFHHEDKNHVKLFYFDPAGEKRMAIFKSIAEYSSPAEIVAEMQQFLGGSRNIPYAIERSIKSHFNGADRFSGLKPKESKKLNAAIAAFK